MAGNPRSILLPVTIKDMKDLKSIKIINAADLKNAGLNHSGIKLAAANLLSQGKAQSYREERTEYEYSYGGNDCGEFPLMKLHETLIKCVIIIYLGI